MIIKYTLNNNDFTQVIEKYLEEYGPFTAMYFKTISDFVEFKENVRKYCEMSENCQERKELKQQLEKIIKQHFINYINDIKENTNWKTAGFNAKELLESKDYILENIKVKIVETIKDKWQNGEVVYYISSNMKYLTM